MGDTFAELDGAIGELAKRLQYGKAFALTIEHHIDMSGRATDESRSSGNGVTVAVKPVFCDGISLHVSHICDKMNV